MTKFRIKHEKDSAPDFVHQVDLKQEGNEVELHADDWIIASLGTDGFLHLFAGIEDAQIRSDAEGYIKVKRDR